MSEKMSIKDELPIGFGLNLAANEEAMERFAQLSEQEKKRIVEGSRHIHSKQEMSAFIEQITSRAD